MLRQAAEARLNATLCTRINDQDDKENCIETAAIASNDTTSCNTIESAGRRDRCLREVAIALSTNPYAAK